MTPDPVPKWLRVWDDDRLFLEHKHAQKAKDLNDDAKKWADQVEAEVEYRRAMAAKE